MITLRNFNISDVPAFLQNSRSDMNVKEAEKMICRWNQKFENGKYFEMFAVLSDDEMVGMISLYQHSAEVISIGPEIFESYRKKGFAKAAMVRALDIAAVKGYKIVFQQIRVDNSASIALHSSLGFETSGLTYTNAKGNTVAIYLKSLL